ncbi:MAG: hypothetical protein U9M92_02145 [Patescibacteria group bacterium]|nr:hypothetical protein [Patescibacteria group bacterium]
MKKRILLSLGVVAVMAAAVAGGTGAFYADHEVSAGNTFTAGAIDLKIDNESYYNGAVSEETTWLEPADLDEGKLFFNFNDLKPDDEGEDTISIHVNNNDAWLCLDMTSTSNDDISSNEPELDTSDPEDDPNDTWDGELAGLIEMVWWVDDGDNVLETGEDLLSDDVQTITELFGDDKTFSVGLADAFNNVWTGEAGPANGGETYYLGKAWCYGDMTLAPVSQDGLDSSGPLDGRGSGFNCDGSLLGNESQTDGTTLDVAFRATQARHNPTFTCNGNQPRTATVTVIKEIVNDNGGDNVIDDFQLYVDNGTVATPVTSGVSTLVVDGDYIVSETGVSGYVASFSGDCDANGRLMLMPGDNKTCTITNNDLPANITLIKEVINDDGGQDDPTQFRLLVDGNLVPNNTSVAVDSNVAHTIDEDNRPGYHFVSITGSPECPDVLGGTATLDEGKVITCTITNDDDYPGTN